MRDCGRHSAAEIAWLEHEEAELRREMRGLVVDFACIECGHKLTVTADWQYRPECCGWEMVDLPGTVRPNPLAAAP